MFHQKIHPKISLGLFGLLNTNSFTILDQVLPTLFHKVDPVALLWCSIPPSPPPSTPPYVVDIVLIKT
jgi:hypothetical protein